MANPEGAQPHIITFVADSKEKGREGKKNPCVANLPPATPGGSPACGRAGCIYTGLSPVSSPHHTGRGIHTAPAPFLGERESRREEEESIEDADPQHRRGEPPGGVPPGCPQGGARRVHLHPHLRLRRPGLRHGLQQADRRRSDDPLRPDRRGGGPRFRPVRGGVRRRQHLRRPREPGRDLRRLPRRQHHPVPRPPLLDRPAPRLHRGVLPPPLLHRRARHRHLRPDRHLRVGGPRAGDRHDLRPRLHRVRHRRGPQEGQPRHHRPHRHRLHRRRQHPGRRRVRRRLHEPGRLLRPCPRQLVLGVPVGVLGWPTHWRWPRRRHLRGPLHLPHPRAAPHHRILS